MPSRAEQQAPTPPSILAWTGREPTMSRAEPSNHRRRPDPIRNEPSNPNLKTHRHR